MRELTQGNACVSITEYIGYEKATRGTETSKYPEEEKETSIPQVAASERGRGQTFDSNIEGVADCTPYYQDLVELSGTTSQRG